MLSVKYRPTEETAKTLWPDFISFFLTQPLYLLSISVYETSSFLLFSDSAPTILMRYSKAVRVWIAIRVRVWVWVSIKCYYCSCWIFHQNAKKSHNASELCLSQCSLPRNWEETPAGSFFLKFSFLFFSVWLLRKC